VRATPVISQVAGSLAPTAAAARIAFVYQQSEYDNELYTVRADGSGLVKVASRADYFDGPAWSPDGQWLAFVAGRHNARDLFVARPDGTDLRQLTFTPDIGLSVNSFAWSPDNLSLLVSRALTNPAGLSTIEFISVYGLTTTTPYQGVLASASPDGHWLAFEGLDAVSNQTLYTTHGGGAPAEPVVTTEGALSGTVELLNGFAWAPDSSRLAYILEGPLTGSLPNAQWGPDPLHARLYTVRPDGSGRQLLLQMTPFPGAVLGPAWSPDGRYLLFALGHAAQGDCFDIHLFDVAARHDTTLQGVCYLPHTLLPDWSPDGRYLVFSAQPQSIRLVDVADALRHPKNMGGLWLTGGPDLTFDPVWQPASR